MLFSVNKSFLCISFLLRILCAFLSVCIHCSIWLYVVLSVSLPICDVLGLTAWSSSSAKYAVQRTRTKFAERAFSVIGPSVWNSLPADLRLESDTAVFKRKLKKITCFVVFLLSSFLRFNVTIVIRYCTCILHCN